jgi:hypothetical protein
MDWGGMGRSHLAQNRDQWWTFVKTIKNRGVPLNIGKNPE